MAAGCGQGLAPAWATRRRAPSAGARRVRKLLEAAAQEFGERGYHEAAITGITHRAGVALGTFYTYFESKEELFRALVRDMSHATRSHVAEAVRGAPDRLAAERIGLAAFIAFTRAASRALPDHRGGAVRRRGRLSRALSDLRRRLSPQPRRRAARAARSREGPDELRAWALIGMSVFLGMRYGIWNEDMDPAEVADHAIDLVSEGLRSTSDDRRPARSASPSAPR